MTPRRHRFLIDFQKIFSDLTSSSSSLHGKAQTSLALRLLRSSVLRGAHPHPFRFFRSFRCSNHPRQDVLVNLSTIYSSTFSSILTSSGLRCSACTSMMLIGDECEPVMALPLRFRRHSSSHFDDTSCVASSMKTLWTVLPGFTFLRKMAE